MTRFREIPSLFHSSATQQISFSIMAIITLALLTFFYWHTPLLFTTLCIFQYLFCIQISKTQFKSLCIYFPGEDIYFTSGVQSIIIIYIYNIILFLWHSIEHFKYIIRLFKQDRHRFGYFTNFAWTVFQVKFWRMFLSSSVIKRAKIFRRIKCLLFQPLRFLSFISFILLSFLKYFKNGLV